MIFYVETDDEAQRHYAPQDTDGDVARNSLESAESYVAGSPGTGEPGDGSSSAFPAAFSALLEWGEARGLIRSQSGFPFFDRQPDSYGDEYEAWFDEPSSRWCKATYRDRFGLAWGRDGSATAREYLTRLVLQNTYFGDDIRLIALVECNKHLRAGLTHEKEIGRRKKMVWDESGMVEPADDPRHKFAGSVQ